MNKNIKMGIIIWIATGILAAIGYGVGQYYINKGRTEKTKEGTQGIIDNDNSNTEKVLQKISTMESNLTERQEVFEEYIKNSILTNKELEKILLEKGYSIEQIEKFADQAIKESQNDFELGNAHFVKGNYEKAIEYFEKSSENAPDKIPTNNQFNLGQAKYKLLEKNYNLDFIVNDFFPEKSKLLLNEIVNHYSEAIAKSPNYYQAYNNRGIIYLNLGLVDKAESDFKKCKLIDVSAPQSYSNLAKLYILKDDPNYINPALTLLNKSIELDPTFTQAYYNRGNILESKLNDFTNAIKDYKEAIKHGMTSKHVYLNLGTAFNRWGNEELVNGKFESAEIKLARALENYDKALEIDLNFEKAIRGKGIVFMTQNQCEKAIILFNNSIQLNENLWETYLFRAKCYASLNEVSLANQDFNKALELDPNRKEFIENERRKFF